MMSQSHFKFISWKESNLCEVSESKDFQRSFSICFSCTKKLLNNHLILKTLESKMVAPHVPICCIVVWSNIELFSYYLIVKIVI
jgi:hypothetical protein